MGVSKIGHRLAIKSIIDDLGGVSLNGSRQFNSTNPVDQNNVESRRLPLPTLTSPVLCHTSQDDVNAIDRNENNYEKDEEGGDKGVDADQSKKRTRRKKDRTKVRNKTKNCSILLDPFLSGEVEVRQYLVMSHADSLFDKLHNLSFEDHHKNRSSLWYGNVDYTYSRVNIQPRGPLSSLRPLHKLGQRLSRDLGCKFNSCLVNLYKTGFDQCGWHADDESIFGEDPTIASISLGCSRQFQLKPIPETPFSRHCKTFFDITLNHGDLLVMKGDVQKFWHHSVPRELEKCTPRINLTFRHVVVS